MIPTIDHDILQNRRLFDRCVNSVCIEHLLRFCQSDKFRQLVRCVTITARFVMLACYLTLLWSPIELCLLTTQPDCVIAFLLTRASDNVDSSSRHSIPFHSIWWCGYLIVLIPPITLPFLMTRSSGNVDSSSTPSFWWRGHLIMLILQADIPFWWWHHLIMCVFEGKHSFILSFSILINHKPEEI